MNNPKQVVILGMHRSGTSVIVRALEKTGLYIGEENSFNPADESNPRGYWELSDVWRANEDILASLGHNWHDHFEIGPDTVRGDKLKPLQNHIRKVIANLNQHAPWAVKDPRMCMLLPLWMPLLDSPVFVITYRDPLEVAMSLRKRDGFPVQFGIALWEKYVRASLGNSTGHPRVLISYAELVRKPEETIAKVVNRLSKLGFDTLRIPAAADVVALVDGALYRNRVPAGEAANYLVPAQAELWEQLLHETGLDEAGAQPLSPAAVDTLTTYNRLLGKLQESLDQSAELERRLSRSGEEAKQYAESLQAGLERKNIELKECGERLIELDKNYADASRAVADLETKYADASRKNAALNSDLSDVHQKYAALREKADERMRVIQVLDQLLTHADQQTTDLDTSRRWRLAKRGHQLIRLVLKAKTPEDILRALLENYRKETNTRGPGV